MSQLTQIIQQLTNIQNWISGVQINSKNISGLPAATTLDPGDQFHVNQGSVDRRAPMSLIADYINSRQELTQNVYNDVPEMLSLQIEQTIGKVQFVVDASADPTVLNGQAYYEYLGGNNGLLTDYRKLADDEVALIADVAAFNSFKVEQSAITLGVETPIQTISILYENTDNKITHILFDVVYTQYLVNFSARAALFGYQVKLYNKTQKKTLISSITGFAYSDVTNRWALVSVDQIDAPIYQADALPNDIMEIQISIGGSSMPVSDSEIIVKDKSQIVGVSLDSTKVYKIDGNIVLLAGETIEIPAGGLTIDGYGFNVSSISCLEDAHTMFKSPVGGSGDFVLAQLSITASGTGSKVFDLTDINGSHAIEIEYVNFSGCKSLGKQRGYRQGTWTTVGVYGCSDGLQLSGSWDGYKISNSNCFGFNAAGTLFKKDTDTLFTNRFFINVNIDFPTGAKLTDFVDANFSINELLQLNSCIAKVNGAINISNSPALVPNISANSLKSLWTGNIGLPDTATEVLIEQTGVTGSFVVDWLKDTYFLTMTGNTTFTESNLPASTKNTQEIKVYLTGNFTPTFPAAWDVNKVGTYKGSDINEISIKYIKSGLYFVKISNSLTVYPAPILGSIIPVSLFPSTTSELRIKGSFYTPQGFVILNGQVVNSIEFDPDTGDYVLSVTTGALEGEFDIIISNGTSVTFANKLIVNSGEVFVPKTSDWTSVTEPINLTEEGNANVKTYDSEGKARWNKLIDVSKASRLEFLLKVSSLGPLNEQLYKTIRLTESVSGDYYDIIFHHFATYAEWRVYKNGTILSGYFGGYTAYGTPGTIYKKVSIRNDLTTFYIYLNNVLSYTFATGQLNQDYWIDVYVKRLDVNNIKHIELP